MKLVAQVLANNWQLLATEHPHPHFFMLHRNKRGDRPLIAPNILVR